MKECSLTRVSWFVNKGEFDRQSWSTMIGMETRIAAKLYRVNMKNGKGLREKFEKVIIG